MQHPVSTTNPGDAIDALLRMAHIEYKTYGEQGLSWTFFQCWQQREREMFERYLIDTKDPLSYEAGSPERRFMAYIKREARTRTT